MSKTSDEIGTLAAEVLNDKNSTNKEKSLAGSALSQINPRNETSEKLGELAAEVLNDENSTNSGKSLAGSVLSQVEK
jgi:hypothetical protein